MTNLCTKDFSDRLAEYNEITAKDASYITKIVLEAIQREILEGNEICFTKYFKLTPIETAPRVGRNMKTGETIKIPSTKRVRLSLSGVMKKKLDA